MNLPLNSALPQLNADGELESGVDFQSFGQCISIYFVLHVLFHAFKTLFLEHGLGFHQMAEGICDTHTHTQKRCLESRNPLRLISAEPAKTSWATVNDTGLRKCTSSRSHLVEETSMATQIPYQFLHPGLSQGDAEALALETDRTEFTSLIHH